MEGAVHEIVAVTDSIWDVPEAIAFAEKEIRQNDSGAPLVLLDWKALMPGLAQSIMMDLISGVIFLPLSAHCRGLQHSQYIFNGHL